MPFGDWAICWHCGEAAYAACGEYADTGEPNTLLVSPVDNFEKAANASGKFGGVAGVLVGAQNWKRIEGKKLITGIKQKCIN